MQTIRVHQAACSYIGRTMTADNDLPIVIWQMVIIDLKLSIYKLIGFAVYKRYAALHEKSWIALVAGQR